MRQYPEQKRLEIEGRGTQCFHIVFLYLYQGNSISPIPFSINLISRTEQSNLNTSQRNAMIKQIKNNGGNWPTSNEKLVNNYLQFFVTFVKSIDFTDLQ